MTHGQTITVAVTLLIPKTSLKQRLNPKDKGVIYMSDYEIFAILLRVIELVLIADLYKSTKK